MKQANKNVEEELGQDQVPIGTKIFNNILWLIVFLAFLLMAAGAYLLYTRSNV